MDNSLSYAVELKRRNFHIALLQLELESYKKAICKMFPNYDIGTTQYSPKVFKNDEGEFQAIKGGYLMRKLYKVYQEEKFHRYEDLSEWIEKEGIKMKSQDLGYFRWESPYNCVGYGPKLD